MMGFRTLNGGRLAFGLVALAMLTSSCTTTVVQQGGGANGELAAVAPMLSVERFLQAVNANDYQSMSRLFGTVDGPFRGNGNATDIEIQMATIAEILRHSDYRIVSEARAPGYEVPTNRIGVNLTIGQRVYPDVPFMVVQTREGRWMIQEIGLENVTGGRGGGR